MIVCKIAPVSVAVPENFKRAYVAGRRRVHRPWIPEPGMQSRVRLRGRPADQRRATILFCFWLAWSPFRVVIPLLDKSWPSVAGAVDAALRRADGVPTCLLTDNEKAVTAGHVAGLPVRNPASVAFGRQVRQHVTSFGKVQVIWSRKTRP